MSFANPLVVSIATRNRAIAELVRAALDETDCQVAGVFDPQAWVAGDPAEAPAELIVFLAEEFLGLLRQRRLSRTSLASRNVVVLASSDLELADIVSRNEFATGILLESGGLTRLCQLLHLAHAGYTVVSQALLHRLAKDSLRLELVSTLSAEERAALVCLGNMKTNREIAEEMNWPSARTKTVVRSVLAKLRLRNRTAAAVFAARYGTEKAISLSDNTQAQTG